MAPGIPGTVLALHPQHALALARGSAHFSCQQCWDRPWGEGLAGRCSQREEGLPSDFPLTEGGGSKGCLKGTRATALALTLPVPTGQQGPVTNCMVRHLPVDLDSQFWFWALVWEGGVTRKCVCVCPHTGCWGGTRFPSHPITRSFPEMMY